MKVGFFLPLSSKPMDGSFKTCTTYVIELLEIPSKMRRRLSYTSQPYYTMDLEICMLLICIF